MRLIALARDRYEDYFRRGLLEQAICEGVDVLYIGFRRSERRIDLVRNGSIEKSLSLFSLPSAIGRFVGEGGLDEPAVIFNSAGYNWFWHVLYLRLTLPRSFLVFDVYDWLFYDAAHLKLFVMKCVDMIYRKASDGIVVVTPELMSYYPGAFQLDNASYVRSGGASESDKKGVAILASFDSRFDFELMESVVDRLAEVDFHCHGWVKEDLPGIRERFARFSGRSNVHYHGQYRNADLESILKPYSIGLLPYATINHINQFVNPEKIYHYLQAGMEVISTPIPQAKRMQAYLHIASTPEEFANCISRLQGGAERKNDDSAERCFHWSERWRKLQPYLLSLTVQ